MGAEGLVDAPVTAEGVDGDGNVGAFDVLEQQRLAPERRGRAAVELLVPVRGGGLAHPVGDLSDLERRAHRCTNAPKLALAVEEPDEVGKRFRDHVPAMVCAAAPAHKAAEGRWEAVET